MAKWIRVIEGLPIVEIKPTSSEGFSDNELMMLLGTDAPSQMFPSDDGTVLLYDHESTAPINERACALLNIPTAKELRERVIANGNQPDEQLLARPDNARAWEIRGDVLLAHVVQNKEKEPMENWEMLKAAAHGAGFQVHDDGTTVEFKRGREIGAYVKNTRPAAKLTGYQAARQWLQQKGVRI